MNEHDQVRAGVTTAEKHELSHNFWVLLTGALVIPPLGYAFKQNAMFQGWVIAILFIFAVIEGYLLYRFYTFYKSALSTNKSLKNRLEPLEKWVEIESVTDLIDFSRTLLNSEWHPKNLLNYPTLHSIKALGNGCSKWTSSGMHDLKTAARNCERAQKHIQFLLQNPISLKTTNPKKAIENARSALILKGLQDDFPNVVQIKTYDHSAELRITIINNTKVHLGHYAAGNNGNSNDTPILFFHDANENAWSFAKAFIRHFDAEWMAGREITDWNTIELIAKKGSQ